MAQELAPLIKEQQRQGSDLVEVKKDLGEVKKEQQRQGRDLGRVVETLARTSMLAKQSSGYAAPMAIGSGMEGRSLGRAGAGATRQAGGVQCWSWFDTC